MINKFILATTLLGVALAAPADEDCSKSEAPHSAQCLTNWFLDAGCQSLYAASPNNDWRDEPDVEKIKQEMADLYEKATSDKATQQDIRRCRPLTDFERQQQQCYEAIAADCKDCSLDVGARVSFVNTTCVADCISDSEDLKDACPTLSQTLQCDKKLEETCGKCVVLSLFGEERLDEDWYEFYLISISVTIIVNCGLPAFRWWTASVRFKTRDNAPTLQPFDLLQRQQGCYPQGLPAAGLAEKSYGLPEETGERLQGLR
jgi:hypothetical protein